MRNLLKEIGHSQVRTYQAIVACFGTRQIHGHRFKIPVRTILLKKITLDGQTVTGHLWVDAGQKLADVKEGDLIQFTAKVDVYVKGYFGTRDRLINPKHKGVDYYLSNLDDIKILKHGQKPPPDCDEAVNAADKRS